MPPRQLDKLELAAEGIRILAGDAGVAVGLDKGMASVVVLEKALAQAWIDVLLFKGANDSPERFQECVRQMVRRIREEMILQRLQRRGHKPS